MRKWTKKKKRNTTSQNHHNYKHHQQQATTVNYLESRCTSSCETSTLPWMDWLSSVIKDRIRGEFMLFQWFRLSICPLSVHALNNFYSKRGEQWCLQNCTNSNLLKLHKELGSIMTTSNSKDWQLLHDLILYKGLIKEGRSDGCDSSQGRQSRKKWKTKWM